MSDLYIVELCKLDHHIFQYWKDYKILKAKLVLSIRDLWKNKIKNFIFSKPTVKPRKEACLSRILNCDIYSQGYQERLYS